jgi:hypothetical protein
MEKDALTKAAEFLGCMLGLLPNVTFTLTAPDGETRDVTLHQLSAALLDGPEEYGRALCCVSLLPWAHGPDGDDDE